jgi:hypothetical protein
MDKIGIGHIGLGHMHSEGKMACVTPPDKSIMTMKEA